MDESRAAEKARFDAWVALLDHCAANLDSFAAAASQGWDITDWTPPSLGDVAQLGALPPSLATRAESLLARTLECERQAENRMLALRKRDRMAVKMRLQAPSDVPSRLNATL